MTTRLASASATPIIIAGLLLCTGCAPGILEGPGLYQDGEIASGDAGAATSGDMLTSEDQGAHVDGATTSPDTTATAPDSQPLVTNKKPAVKLTTPSTGATFSSGSSISITASASDPDGKVVSVKFYDGATLLKLDSAAPFSFSWSSASAGTHTLTAKAIDDKGAQTTSSAITITVKTTTPTAVSYSKTIQPILDAKCKSCHGPTKAAGQYRVDSYAATLKAGISGKPAVTAQDPQKSLIYTIEAGATGSCGLCWHNYLGSSELKLVESWITQGALNN